MQTITWTSKTGKTITATPSEYMPQTWLTVTVDGKQIKSGYLMSATDKDAANIAKQLVAAGLTHVVVCGTTPIGVPPDVAVQIKDAQAAASNRPISLESQREMLVAAVQGAGDVFSAARESAFNNDDGRGWDKVRQAEQTIKTAEQALADFDATHPDVIAKIKAEQRQSTERFLAAD